MNSRHRQDAIIRNLRRSGATTVMALCDEVGASRSTILRDLSALRDEGYVIIAEQGRGGGIYLDPSSVQTTAKLSVPEVFALIIGISSMRAAGSLQLRGWSSTTTCLRGSFSWHDKLSTTTRAGQRLARVRCISENLLAAVRTIDRHLTHRVGS